MNGHQFCNWCGKPLHPIARFCSSCGAAIQRIHSVSRAPALSEKVVTASRNVVMVSVRVVVMIFAGIVFALVCGAFAIAYVRLLRFELFLVVPFIAIVCFGLLVKNLFMKK